MRFACLLHLSEPSYPVAGLPALGHEVEIIRLAAPSLAGRLLTARGFAAELAALPGATLKLSRGGFDVAYAPSPFAAAAVLALPERSRPPLILAFERSPEREALAARRLELTMLSRALDACDALVATDEPVAADVRRWLAVEPLLVPEAASLAELCATLAK